VSDKAVQRSGGRAGGEKSGSRTRPGPVQKYPTQHIRDDRRCDDG